MPYTKYDPMIEESKFMAPTTYYQEEDVSDQPTVIDWNSLYRQQDTTPRSPEDDWFLLPL